MNRILNDGCVVRIEYYSFIISFDWMQVQRTGPLYQNFNNSTMLPTANGLSILLPMFWSFTGIRNLNEPKCPNHFMRHAAITGMFRSIFGMCDLVFSFAIWNILLTKSMQALLSCSTLSSCELAHCHICVQLSTWVCVCVCWCKSVNRLY